MSQLTPNNSLLTTENTWHEYDEWAKTECKQILATISLARTSSVVQASCDPDLYCYLYTNFSQGNTGDLGAGPLRQVPALLWQFSASSFQSCAPQDALTCEAARNIGPELTALRLQPARCFKAAAATSSCIPVKTQIRSQNKTTPTLVPPMGIASSQLQNTKVLKDAVRIVAHACVGMFGQPARRSTMGC